MDTHLDLDELVANWTLVGDEPNLIAGKRGPTRLGFALQLKFYGRHGRFLNNTSELPDDTIEFVARQVKVDSEALSGYDWSSRAVRFHRAEIRAHFGFQECSKSDADQAVDLEWGKVFAVSGSPS